MFAPLISRRAKVATALAGVPAVAAGLWLTTAGPAQAAEKPSAVSVSVSSAKPTAGEPVLIKASKRKGKNRIVTVRNTGKVDLSRSKATKSDGLSTDGTWMVLTKVGTKKNPKYTIMSLNDSEEADGYCLQQKKSGALNIVVCDADKANQRFGFTSKDSKFAIEGKWGYLKADKRQLRKRTGDETASYFSVVKK
jgi:hypothetical protein